MRTNELVDLLPDMAVFVRVVETGSFSAAARQLGQTPSAVSRQVARLEHALGVRLLVRTTRSLRLSESGAEAFQCAQDMLASARGVLAVADRFMREPEGLVRVSMPKAFGRQVIHPLMPAFLARYPKVDVQLIFNDRVLDPVVDEVDLAIHATDAPPPGMVGRVLRPITHRLCATPEYLARAGTPQHPQELLQHSCLYLGEAPDDCRWQFRQDGHVETVRVHGRYVVNHSEVRLEGVLNHLGIGSLPDFTAHAALEQGKIVQVLADWEFLTPAYYGAAWLLYPANRHLPPKVRAMVDFLVEKAGMGNQ